MISNRAILELNEYEKRQYTSSSRAELNNDLLELNAYASLVGQIVGHELLKKDSKELEKLKADLVESTSSLNSALDANITLAKNNKFLKSENERIKGEASELKKVVYALKAENGFLCERCSVAEEKELTTVDRATMLSEEVVDLEQRVVDLTVNLEEERSRRVNTEKELGKFQDYLIDHTRHGRFRGCEGFSFKRLSDYAPHGRFRGCETFSFKSLSDYTPQRRFRGCELSLIQRRKL